MGQSIYKDAVLSLNILIMIKLIHKQCKDFEENKKMKNK